MKAQWNIADWVSQICSGNRVALSRAITLVESQKASHQETAFQLLNALPPSKNSIRLGITGIPGVGKSTFIEAFGTILLEEGYKVAVLAIDPSSQQSGGSILGDKIRMPQLAQAPNAYIRPTPSSGILGGVAPQTQAVIQLCEAAGFDFILIETVGVGQSEVEVSQLCDIFILLMLAGAGDEIQGIKRGIMELADFILINKSDGDNLIKAEQARLIFTRSLHFFEQSAHKIPAQCLAISALNGSGIADFLAKTLDFKEKAILNGYWLANREEQSVFWFRNQLKKQWEAQLETKYKAQIQQAEADIRAGKNVLEALKHF